MRKNIKINLQMNLFYNLPQDLQQYIYEYDATYKECMNNCLKEMCQRIKKGTLMKELQFSSYDNVEDGTLFKKRLKRWKKNHLYH